MTSGKGKCTETKGRWVVARGTGWEEGLTTKGQHEEIGEAVTVLCHD